jgi:hypothetical protein
VVYTKPTDGLGFCAAWCFFLAECRILNPDLPVRARALNCQASRLVKLRFSLVMCTHIRLLTQPAPSPPSLRSCIRAGYRADAARGRDSKRSCGSKTRRLGERWLGGSTHTVRGFTWLGGCYRSSSIRSWPQLRYGSSPAS